MKQALQQFKHLTKRFRDWAKTQMCDEFLLATIDFVSAHFRIVKHKMKKLQHQKRKCDCVERFKDADKPLEKCEQIIQKCEDAIPIAEEEKKEAQTALGLKYAEVLRANLAVKFDVNTKPYDETAFYEAVYKFVNHTIRQYRVDQNGTKNMLCPPAMWKELDVELGRIFRGEDFNLEERGLARDEGEVGAWVPKLAKGRAYKKINIHAAISRRSPAVALTYKSQADILLEGKAKQRPETALRCPSDIVPRYAKLRHTEPQELAALSESKPKQRPQTASTRRAGTLPHASSTAAATISNLLTFSNPGVQILEADVGPQSLARSKPNARQRPRTATIRGSNSNVGLASLGEQRYRPTSAKTARGAQRARPFSSKPRPGSASSRPSSATTRTLRGDTQNCPWAAHQNWKPGASFA